MERESSPNFEEQQSAIRRVVGLSETDEKEILGKARESFTEQEKLPFEREKTERELRIINDILSQLPKFLGEYGVKPLPLTADHIHIADEAALATPEQKNAHGIPDGIGGVYLETRQGVVVFASENDLNFAERVAHEALHANSFTSFIHKKGGYALRRGGLVIVGNKGESYFHNLDEGLTEELAKRFDKKYSEKMLSLSEAVAKRKEFVVPFKSINPNTNTDEIMSVIIRHKPGEQWEVTTQNYVYPEERQELLKLMEDLYEKNRNRFNSPEDVFRLFVQASFTGRMLEIASLVESTFGKGSFRKLGEKTKWTKSKKP